MAQKIENALIECGVNADKKLIVNIQTTDARIAEDVFDNDFNTWMDMTPTSLREKWKNYSNLTQNQGQIRLRNNTQKNIRDLVQ